MEFTQARRAELPALIHAAPDATPRDLAGMLAERGVHGSDGRAFSARTVRRDLAYLREHPVAEMTAAGAPSALDKAQHEVIREIIGRSTGANNFWYSNRFIYSVDRTRTDYRFWDLFRNGLALGYELVGALGLPITEILADYIIGDAPTYVVNGEDLDEDKRKYTNAALMRFVRRNLPLFLLALIDLFGLGDQWIIMNPDGSISLPSPDTVTPRYDPTDHRKLVEVTIRTSDLGIIVYDTYRADSRTIKIQRGSDIQYLRYDNLIGRLPVVQWSNGRRANDLYGHPIYEALLPIFSHYDDLLQKLLSGVKVSGNPIPVMEGMDNLTDTIAANAAPTDLQYREDGVLVTSPQVNIDTNGMWFVGKGGTAKFLAPQVGFTKDMWDSLHSLFVLMLIHVGIPEVLTGGVVESTRATAEVQLPPFERRINARRKLLDGVGADEESGEQARGGMLELVDLYLRMRAVTDPKILVAPVESMWPSVSETADNVRLQKIIFSKGQGLLDDIETLQLQNLVTNPQASVERAQAEIAARPPVDGLMQRVGNEQSILNQTAHQDMNPESRVPQTKVNDKTLPPLPGGGRRARQPQSGKPVGETVQEIARNGKKR